MYPRSDEDLGQVDLNFLLTLAPKGAQGDGEPSICSRLLGGTLTQFDIKLQTLF